MARHTGVVLDPAYSGKAMVGFLKDVSSNPAEWANSNVLFLHTGGLLGIYDRLDFMQPAVQRFSRVRRMPLG